MGKSEQQEKSRPHSYPSAASELGGIATAPSSLNGDTMPPPQASGPMTSSTAAPEEADEISEISDDSAESVYGTPPPPQAKDVEQFISSLNNIIKFLKENPKYYNQYFLESFFKCDLIEKAKAALSQIDVSQPVKEIPCRSGQYGAVHFNFRNKRLSKSKLTPLNPELTCLQIALNWVAYEIKLLNSDEQDKSKSISKNELNAANSVLQKILMPFIVRHLEKYGKEATYSRTTVQYKI